MQPTPSTTDNQKQKPLTLLQKLLPLSFIALYYIIVAIIFIHQQNEMSTAFVFSVPFVMGALVSYFVNIKQKTSFLTSFKYVCILLILTLIIAAIVFKEGSICLIILSPILLLCMTFGAALMQLFLTYLYRKNQLLSIVFLPFVISLMPIQTTAENYHSHQKIIINNTPERIWQEINHVNHIHPADFSNSVASFIGTPTPISGNTININSHLIRQVKWGKGIYFDEPIISYVPNRFVEWEFKFYPDSVPAGALDDHVKIGGEHFDFNTASYTLIPISKKQTKLIFNVSYKVNTQFNWYTGTWAKFVMDDFSSVVLNFYKHRLEQSVS